MFDWFNKPMMLWTFKDSLICTIEVIIGIILVAVICGLIYWIKLTIEERKND